MISAMPADRPPNVVIFISDQQRADTMPGLRAAAGVQTPHLDWLAGRGTLFRNAFCVTPLCTPARAALLSGLYPHTNGLVCNYDSGEQALPEDLRLLADYLQAEGYACGYAGKWHLASRGDRRGFRDFTSRSGERDVDSPAQNDFLSFCTRAGIQLAGTSYPAQADPDDYDRRTRIGSWKLPLAWHLSMRDATEAAHFIRRMERDPRPFLLVYSCFEPHRPLASPRPFARMYAGQRMPLPETRRDPNGPALLERRNDGSLQSAEEFDDEDLEAMWAAYYGSVSYVDHLVGTVLAALIESDQLDNTLFVFTSDHGEMLGSHQLLWKGPVFYEELSRVPLLVLPPGGLRAPHATDRLACHVDLVPTVLRWCGARVPEGQHGVDLRALIEGGNAPVRDGVALEYHSHHPRTAGVPLRGWRTEEWKYVEGPGGAEELFDLRRDPLETRNVVADAAGARAAAQAGLYRWMDATDDDWPHPLTR